MFMLTQTGVKRALVKNGRPDFTMGCGGKKHPNGNIMTNKI